MVGPFTATERVCSWGYCLELPDTMLVHGVFHVCYLRSYKDEYGKRAPVPDLDEKGETKWEVDTALDHHSRKADHVSSNICCMLLGLVLQRDRRTTEASGCKRLVQQYWDKKPVAERTVAAVCVATF